MAFPDNLHKLLSTTPELGSWEKDYSWMVWKN